MQKRNSKLLPNGIFIFLNLDSSYSANCCFVVTSKTEKSHQLSLFGFAWCARFRFVSLSLYPHIFFTLYLSSSLSLSLSFSTSFFLNELSLSLFHSQACFILNVFLHMAIKHKYVETFRTRPFKGTHSSPFEIHKYVLTFTKGIKAHIKYTFRVCNPKWLALRSIMSYWFKAF